MFTLGIEASQKRWVALEAVTSRAVFHCRTTIEELEVVGVGGAEGSVSVQKEMFLNRFPSGQTLEFVNGILQEWSDLSIRPYRMVSAGTIPASGGGASTAFNISENYSRVLDFNHDTFVAPVTVTFSIDGDDIVNYGWSVLLANASTISGTAEYGASTNTLLSEEGVSAGITASITACPASAGIVDTHVVVVGEQCKLEMQGTWDIATSFADGSNPLLEPGLSIAPSGTDLEFTFRGSPDIVYTKPWSLFADGAWVELEDPTDPAMPMANKRKAGVSIKFGEGSTGLSIPGADVAFEGALLSNLDTQQAYADGLPYVRTIDIIDLQGSLERYDELRLFYKSPRWIKAPAGGLVLHTLQADAVTGEYTWKVYTGTFTTTDASYVRTCAAKEERYAVEAADTEAEAVISMLRLFKAQYTEYMNLSFSTDTDEYPDSEEIFDI